MKKASVLIVLMLICGSMPGCVQPDQKFSVSYYDYFDTVITITGYAKDRAAFDAVCEEARAEFAHLHALFDKYESHENVNGVWALNHAEGEPLVIEKELFELLSMGKSLYEKSGSRVNIAMGAVLEIWSAYREAGVELPPRELLEAAREKCDLNALILDEAAETARVLPPQTLDVGAVAKGYAVERVASLIKARMPSYLIDAGGNIRAGEAPPNGKAAWLIGIQDPEKALLGESGLIMKLALVNASAVTSGGYQRYYSVDGIVYHHLIDPVDLMPARHFLQTTIVTRDSGLADFLSTAAFLLPYEQSVSLIESFDEVEAIWVMPDGELRASLGIDALIQP